MKIISNRSNSGKFSARISSSLSQSSETLWAKICSKTWRISLYFENYFLTIFPSSSFRFICKRAMRDKKGYLCHLC
ncbi:unnamed protein product [Moneuplotes crassus]|uniref:Uncharacterized protein n=1 Tax=Euplotes crassus TaxID=5936 RepID=A0AAD1Y772_EUPCR|nr:unnamed protein product [Moneuplotes crassus]